LIIPKLGRLAKEDYWFLGENGLPPLTGGNPIFEIRRKNVCLY
jgi:hypothetical protein